MVKYEIFQRAFLNCDNYYCQNIKHFPSPKSERGEKKKNKKQPKLKCKQKHITKLADIEGVLHNPKLWKIKWNY